MVHSESVASLITELALRHTCMEKFRALLYQILSEHGGVDLASFVRPGTKKKLWEEIQEIQNQRNGVLHRAEKASPERALQAIEVASAILENLFPAVAARLGLHIHDRIRLCNDRMCEYKARYENDEFMLQLKAALRGNSAISDVRKDATEGAGPD